MTPAASSRRTRSSDARGDNPTVCASFWMVERPSRCKAARILTSIRSNAARRPPALDRIDVRILAALQRDGRSTIQKLAQTVGLSPRASLERVRRLEAAGVIAGYHAVVELGRLARPVNVFAEINLEKQANRGRFEKRLAAIDAVVECWEVSGTVDYIARFVCADLAEYEELTSALLDDDRLGAARIVSHVALRPIRRFAGYPEKLLGRNPAKR